MGYALAQQRESHAGADVNSFSRVCRAQRLGAGLQDQRDRVVLVGQVQTGCPGVRVLDRIAEPFQGRVDEQVLYGLGDVAALAACGDLDPASCGPLEQPGFAREPCLEGEPLGWLAQPVQRSPQLAARLRRGVLDLLQRGGEGGGVALLACVVGGHADGEQHLGDGVVQLGGDALPVAEPR